MEKQNRVLAVLEAIEGIPRYEWEQIKDLVDKKFSQQTLKVNFNGGAAFKDYCLKQISQ